MKLIKYGLLLVTILIVIAVVAVLGFGVYANKKMVGPGYIVRVSNASGTDVMLRIHNIGSERKILAERLSRAGSWNQIKVVTGETEGTELVCTSGSQSATYVLGGKLSALPDAKRHSFRDGKMMVELTINPGLTITLTQANERNSSTQPQSAPAN